MLENAGFLRVKREDTGWDAAAGYDDAEHRRPDVTCLHPVTRVKWVLDVVVFWGDSAGTENGFGIMATRREQYKERRYRRAMRARQEEQMGDGAEPVDDGLVAQEQRFIPLGFEVGGAFGRATEGFLREVEMIAAGQSSSDLYHWSGAEWRSHWRQRLSLRLAIGHAAPVLEAVDRARCNADVGRSAGHASLEWTETGCRPCVS
eukprot:SAG11_NODE_6388_length_1323_cov_1.513072_2_plen_204_part_00